MSYRPEKWVPKPKIHDVFAITLENLEQLKALIGATDVRVAYNRNRTVLVEWTMMHRESFSGMVGQYIVRNDHGEFLVLDTEELTRDYMPYIPEVKTKNVVFNHEELGRLLAVHRNDETNEVDEVLFELPSGNPATFSRRVDELVPQESDEIVEKKQNSNSKESK